METNIEYYSNNGSIFKSKSKCKSYENKLTNILSKYQWKKVSLFPLESDEKGNIIKYAKYLYIAYKPMQVKLIAKNVDINNLIITSCLISENHINNYLCKHPNKDFGLTETVSIKSLSYQVLVKTIKKDENYPIILVLSAEPISSNTIEAFDSIIPNGKQHYSYKFINYSNIFK